MTIFIEGPALPLDIKNVNGWGVKTPDADAAISSLKSSVIRVCPRDSPHGCDISEDPNREIGHIVDAWQQNGVVMTKAAITDSIAKQKIQDGTWGNKWSVYAPNYESLDDGWAKGISIKSLTLVQNPAWADAHYDLSASADGKYELRNVSEFTLITSQNLGSETITKELEDKIKEPDTKLKASTKFEDELKQKADSVGPLETQVAELTASKATLEKELGDKTTLVASLEKEKTGMITLKEVEEIANRLSASASEKAIADYIETQKKTALIAGIIEIREGLKIKADNEKLKTISASDLEERLAELNSIKLIAGGPGSGPTPAYPAAPSGGVGNYNTGEWKV